MGFKEGDFIKIIDRETTPADAKSSTYYPFYRGLVGVVDRVYDEKEVCIKVDTDSLPADVLKRHVQVQDAIKKKWLNNLSGEARNRLSAEDKQFTLAYTLLVQMNDLEKALPSDKPKPAAVKNAKAIEAAVVAESAEVVAETPEAPEAPEPKVEKVKPVTSKDLEEAETAFLREREQALKAEGDGDQ